MRDTQRVNGHVSITVYYGCCIHDYTIGMHLLFLTLSPPTTLTLLSLREINDLQKKGIWMEAEQLINCILIRILEMLKRTSSYSIYERMDDFNNIAISFNINNMYVFVIQEYRGIYINDDDQKSFLTLKVAPLLHIPPFSTDSYLKQKRVKT